MREKSEISLRIDRIEDSLYRDLKQLGFRKYGRTLHRFFLDDISQVIRFQCGQAYREETHLLCVGVGIRVPECDRTALFLGKPPKKYYHDYECNIRSSLGDIDGEAVKCFDLRGDIDAIEEEIYHDIFDKVLPVFNVLSTREGILAHRGEYPNFDRTGGVPLVDEALIYRHLGDEETAQARFRAHYQMAVDRYRDELINGQKVYLKKGQRVICGGQEVTAQEDGFVTLYAANHGHIDYLDQLAKKLGFSDCIPEQPLL